MVTKKDGESTPPKKKLFSRKVEGNVTGTTILGREVIRRKVKKADGSSVKDKLVTRNNGNTKLTTTTKQPGFLAGKTKSIKKFGPTDNVAKTKTITKEPGLLGNRSVKTGTVERRYSNPGYAGAKTTPPEKKQSKISKAMGRLGTAKAKIKDKLKSYKPSGMLMKRP
jgi:hypothetical protein